MPRRKKMTDWPDAPTLDAPEKMFDGAIGRTCVGGPDAPNHSSAACPMFSWVWSRRMWWVCACACHTHDLRDHELVEDIKQDMIATLRQHRAWAGW